MRLHVHGGCLSGDATLLSGADATGRSHFGILFPGPTADCVRMTERGEPLGGLVLWCPTDSPEAIGRMERALLSALDCVPGAWARRPPW